jgi:predicted DNA-binding protein
MIKIFDCEQGSDEWHKIRFGRPTASRFKDIIAKGEGKTRAAYMRELAAEHITQEKIEGYSNIYMQRGKDREDQVRRDVIMDLGIDPDIVRRVGFVTNGWKGASPDCFIGDDGGMEIKTMRADLLIEELRKARTDPSWYPPEHKAQVQGSMWITGRKWWLLVVDAPKMPRLVRKIERDLRYHEDLHNAVNAFTVELNEMLMWLGNPGIPA